MYDIVGPLVDGYREELQLTDKQIVLLQTAIVAPAVIFQPFNAYIQRLYLKPHIELNGI